MADLVPVSAFFVDGAWKWVQAAENCRCMSFRNLSKGAMSSETKRSLQKDEDKYSIVNRTLG